MNATPLSHSLCTNISCQGTPDTGVDGIWFMTHGKIVKAKMEKNGVSEREKKGKKFAKIEWNVDVAVCGWCWMVDGTQNENLGVAMRIFLWTQNRGKHTEYLFFFVIISFAFQCWRFFFPFFSYVKWVELKWESEMSNEIMDYSNFFVRSFTLLSIILFPAGTFSHSHLYTLEFACNFFFPKILNYNFSFSTNLIFLHIWWWQAGGQFEFHKNENGRKRERFWNRDIILGLPRLRVFLNFLILSFSFLAIL